MGHFSPVYGFYYVRVYKYTMITITHPIWSKLRVKDRKDISEKMYYDIIMQSLTPMFKYSHNVADPTFKRAVDMRLEEMLRLAGKVAFFEDKEGLKFGTCHFGNGKNDVDWVGTSNGVTITTMDGQVYERELGADCVIMNNNNLAQSELNIFRFASQLAEVDISQLDMIYNARNHPIIVARNDKDAEIIKKALNDTKLGVPTTIAQSGSLAKSCLQGVDDKIEVVTLTDPQTATLFQYYSHYHLDLTGRLYGMFGLSTFNTGKMAQTNDLEVSGSLASSMVIPLNNYNERAKACEDISKMFDVEFSVEFGDAWKNQLSMLQGINKEVDYNINTEEMDENGDGIVNDNDKTEKGVKETNDNE